MTLTFGSELQKMLGNIDDLRHKGFCVLNKLFDQTLIDTILQDFELIKDFDSPNKNYPILPAGKRIPLVGLINNIIEPICNEIKNNLPIVTDFTPTPIYFSIGKGVNFNWHQDHESYFQSGDHVDYLNFYIPIHKPTIEMSNLSVVDFKKLCERDPNAQFLKGLGATRLFAGSTTLVKNDNNDTEYVIPFNIEEVSETPNLAVGDALIMRGDCIHKTQDTLTPRIAISIRRLNTKTIVNKSHFNITSVAKKYMFENNKELYDRIIAKFQTSDTLTLGELLNVRN
jgi:hypothetical protein